MPWINENGERKYKVSLYCKEELPTWDELYNKFFKGQIFIYDPNNPDHQKLDPYWKRPERKMLLAWACNQLNKMIYEDGVAIKQFMEDKYGATCYTVDFILIQCDESGNIDFDDTVERYFQVEDGPPEIYTCKLPSTNEYSIFTSKHPHCDIDDLKKSLSISCFLHNEIGITQFNGEKLQEIIAFVLKDVIIYFENGIGWKDAEGNLLPVDPSSKTCEGTGFDPAL